MRIDIRLHQDPAIRDLSDKLDYILHYVKKIYSEVHTMTIEVDNLKDKIAALESAVDQLIALAKQLAINIAAAKEDPAAIQALSDSVQGELDKVNAELAADTPATPAV